MNTTVINKAAVYVFRDALCQELGFTLTFRYFKTLHDANAYASNFKFATVVEF